MTRLQRGFTLMESVVVMVLTGILVGAVAVFIQAPMQGYADTARRAEITDTADTAVRRLARDLHLALPNSVRITGSNQILEFLSTRAGGRYRYALDTGTEDILNFSAADTSFEVLGPAITRVSGDQIVVFNLGITGADAYAGDNRTSFDSNAGNIITITSKLFPFDSPNHRFQVVDGPVTYFCDLTAGKLWRYWGYTIQALHTSTDTISELDALVSPPSATRGKTLLAQNLSACTFTYDTAVTERSGLVSMQLSFTQGGETVSLYHAVHVSNVP